MRLKRVRVYGFKTFADRTDFDVDGSVIAVVGPNGCGKSNLVDAILWGLGEGSPKQLRAESGQDVIFAGSRARKPLGYAEVTLLFDNEDGSLPIETSEVAITRRLNRAGESEYQINRRPCRLRDILELLADSGLGRAGYAIVGQRDIDIALAASPEDRRAWVDEAAGVMRYRIRKAESLRRLEAARQHLLRVDDILSEIESQRGPLAGDAEAARQYKATLGSLRELESGLLITEVAKAAQEANEAGRRASEAARLAEKEARLAASLEREIESATATISDLEKTLDGLRARQHKALSDFERAVSDLKLGEQRLRSLADLEEGLAEEAGSAANRIEEARAELEHCQADARVEERRRDETREATAGAGQQARKLAGDLKALEARIAEARARYAERLKREAEEAHRKERLAEVNRELEGIEASLPDLQSAVAEAEGALAARVRQVAEAEKALEKLRGELASLSQQESQAHEATRKLLSDKALLEGKARGIEATISSHEGLQQGARNVLDGAKAKRLEGQFVPVGEAIEVPKEYALAFDIALGGAANDLIVHDEQQAKRAIEFLKQTGGGRATFQPLTLVRPDLEFGEIVRLLGRKGVVGRASDLVRCEERYRPVVESLLGRVLIVETLDDALSLTNTRGWNRLVSLEGEVVHHSGSVTGGHGMKPTYGMVQRKADLAALRREIAEVEGALKAAAAGEAKRRKDRSRIEAKIANGTAIAAQLQADADEARAWLQSLSEELSSTLKSQDKLATERARLQSSEASEYEPVKLDALEEERDALLRQLASRSADAEQADERLREAERRLEQAKLRCDRAARRLQHLLDLEKGRQRKLLNVEPERRKIQAEIEAAASRREAASKEREAVAHELQQAQERRRENLERSLAQTERLKLARAAAQKATEAAHAAELARARADARRGASAQRLLEEYGVSESEAVAKAPEVRTPKDAATVAARLRRELKAMGDVNVGAIEAYERLTARFEELHTQRKDILAGIRELEAGVRELDGLTRERFRITFEKVRSAFSETFQKLFPGGEGRVRLTNPDDLLASGIEIDVTLPGKTRQKLELLSGGERSLCAMAFLFSLLEVKPSPLVVLDEVDAPLDGRNVERFNELLLEYSHTTQFIVITHNVATIAAAPVVVGVTMQEPGVSTIVPVSFPEARNALATARAVVEAV